MNEESTWLAPWSVNSRVPLIMNVPEELGGATGRQISEIVECVDVVPTLLRQVGIPVPSEVQGDQLPVTEKDESCSDDNLGLTEHTGWKSLRLDGYRYISEASGEEHLYDLEQDPWEYNDVAGEPEYEEVLNDARKALIQKMLNIEQPLPKEWPY